jgi:hypothetical protein
MSHPQEKPIFSPLQLRAYSAKHGVSLSRAYGALCRQYSEGTLAAEELPASVEAGEVTCPSCGASFSPPPEEPIEATIEASRGHSEARSREAREIKSIKAELARLKAAAGRTSTFQRPAVFRGERVL